MEVVVSKKVTRIDDPHLRLEAYLDIVELISKVYGEKADPRSSYLLINAVRENIPEEKYFGSEPVEEVREYLKQSKVTWIESSFPGSFMVGDWLWQLKGEGVVMFGVEVGLSCTNLNADEIRNLQKLVIKSSSEYAIEVAGRKIRGEG